MKTEVRDNGAALVGFAESFDTGDSLVGMELGAVMHSLGVLYAIVSARAQGPVQPLFTIRSRATSPWLEVTFGRTGYAIWRSTGYIYRMTNGAVEDEPWIEF